MSIQVKTKTIHIRKPTGQPDSYGQYPNYKFEPIDIFAASPSSTQIYSSVDKWMRENSDFIDFYDSGFLKENLTKTFDWTFGGYINDSGTIVSSTRTTYTTDILQFDYPIIFTSDKFDTYEISVVIYNNYSNDVFYHRTCVNHLIPIPKGYRFRLQMRARASNVPFSSDIYDHCFVYKIHTFLNNLFVRGISNEKGIIAADTNDRNWGLLEPIKIEKDSIIGLKDYSQYKYTIQIFDDYSAYALTSNVYYDRRRDIAIPAGKYIRVIINKFTSYSQSGNTYTYVLDNSITRQEAEEQFTITPKHLKVDDFVNFCNDGYFKEDLFIKTFNWSMGYFNPETHNLSSSTRTIYTTDILQFDCSTIFTSDDFNTYEISVIFYNQNDDNILYCSSLVTNSISIPKGYRFRVQMRARASVDINLDIYNHCFLYKIYPVSESLFVHGISDVSGLIVPDKNIRNWGLFEPIKIKEDSVIELRDYLIYRYTLQVFNNYNAYSTPSKTYYGNRNRIKVSAGKYIRIIINRNDLSNIITKKDAEEQLVIIPNRLLEQLDGNLYDISQIRNRLNALENNNTIPSYYQDHIDTKIGIINNFRNNLTSGTQFAFITDVHVNGYNQTFHSKALLNYLCQNTLIKEVFNGGDVANGKYNPQLEKVEFCKQVRKGVEYCNPDSYAKTFFIVGNHDAGEDYGGGQTVEQIITADELYDISGIKNMKAYITSQDKNCPFNYTYIDDVNKIYYIIGSGNLKGTVTNETYTNFYIWFCNALKACPKNYTIVVFNHEIIISSSDKRLIKFVGELCTVIKEYNERRSSPIYANNASTVIDFSDCEGKVACLIGGHSHIDFSKSAGDTIIVDDGNNSYTITVPVPIIVTTTDNCGAESTAAGHLTRVEGEVSEQAFDVFTIDTSNELIHVTRIGAGENREFTY